VKFDVVAAVSADFYPGHERVVLTVLRFLCIRLMYLTSGPTAAAAGTWARGDWRGSVLDVGEEKTDPARGRLDQSASQLACLR
jgi:hypothetical protein